MCIRDRVRIECDLVGAILIETYLLPTMNFRSLIATKATRITGLNTHTLRSVMEFSTRRSQGESAGNDGAYAAVLGGCIGTANCLAEMKYGSEVKAVGTAVSYTHLKAPAVLHCRCFYAV